MFSLHGEMDVTEIEGTRVIIFKVLLIINWVIKFSVILRQNRKKKSSAKEISQQMTQTKL